MPDFLPDLRQHAPATERNRSVILKILRQVLPPSGTVLEISSGTGEHAVFFAPHLAPRHWLPSDPNPLALASIRAWQQIYSYELLYAPIELDASAQSWPVESANFLTDCGVKPAPIEAIVNINMIHIAPKAAYLGLLSGAGRILGNGGILYLYGPFFQAGVQTAVSNVAFDASLRSQNLEWGIRDLDEVVAAAKHHRLSLKQVYAMPANNLSVVFEKCI